MFTDRPLVEGLHVMLLFTPPEIDMGFESCLSVGLSSNSPDSMRREDLPSTIEGWGRLGSGIWSSTIENLTRGDIVDLWLTDDLIVRFSTSYELFRCRKLSYIIATLLIVLILSRITVADVQETGTGWRGAY